MAELDTLAVSVVWMCLLFSGSFRQDSISITANPASTAQKTVTESFNHGGGRRQQSECNCFSCTLDSIVQMNY